jgi:hypothetical protein
MIIDVGATVIERHAMWQIIVDIAAARLKLAYESAFD